MFVKKEDRLFGVFFCNMLIKFTVADDGGFSKHYPSLIVSLLAIEQRGLGVDILELTENDQ